MLSCTGNRKGQLFISAASKGTYEIYKIAGEQPIQLSSETIGRYNEDVPLAPGSYFIFADCSSELVVIKSKRKTELVADRIKFKAPKDAVKTSESFIIQCTRHERTQSRQRLVNTFNLNVLRGTRELLVGMTALKFAPPKNNDEKKPQTYEYQLSALRVAGYEGMATTPRYFVSPKDSMVSVTESQGLGNWLFLMEGIYNVELNGSHMAVEIGKSESKSIDPAFIKVSSPPEAQLELAKSIQGNPLFVEINDGHWLNLNETYPVLPGPARLRMAGSESTHDIELISSQLNEKAARSVQVNLNCPPWDWACLGSRKVYLYLKDAHYPFAEGLTDVPLLFFEADAWLTLEGSREIRTLVKKDKPHADYRTASLHILPKPDFKNGIITDLVRVESVGEGNTGNTLDLSLDSPSTVYVLPGTYNLAEYITSTNQDGDRRKISRRIFVSSGEAKDFEVSTYLSEKKMRTLAKQTPVSEQIRRSARRKLYSQKYRTPIPLNAM